MAPVVCPARGVDHRGLRPRPTSVARELARLPHAALDRPAARARGRRSSTSSAAAQQAARKILEQLAVAPDAKANLLERVARLQLPRARRGRRRAAARHHGARRSAASSRRLNAIWGVTERRPWARRIPDYLAVMVTAPLMLGVAISLRAAFESQRWCGGARVPACCSCSTRAGSAGLPLSVGDRSRSRSCTGSCRTRACAGARRCSAGSSRACCSASRRRLRACSRRRHAPHGRRLRGLGLVAAVPGLGLHLVGDRAARRRGRVRAPDALAVPARSARQGGRAPPRARRSGSRSRSCCARAFRDGAAPWHQTRSRTRSTCRCARCATCCARWNEAGIVSRAAAASRGLLPAGAPGGAGARIRRAGRAARHPNVPLGVAELSRTVNSVIAEVERAGGAVAEARNLRDLLGGAARRS